LTEEEWFKIFEDGWVWDIKNGKFVRPETGEVDLGEYEIKDHYHL